MEQWLGFVDALNSRADELRAARAKEEAEKGSEPSDAEVDESMAGQKRALEESTDGESTPDDFDDVASSNDSLDESEDDESEEVEEDAASDGDYMATSFAGIDPVVLKGSSKSFESKLGQKLEKAAEESRERRLKLRKERQQEILNRLNVRDPHAKVNAHELHLQELAKQGVVAFYVH